MPLQLTDFNQSGLEVDALALIVAAAPPYVYADADRGGSQSPEAGSDIGIGPGETRISRIGIQSSGEGVLLNDNDNPVELTMREHFGQLNETAKWRLYIQTDGGVAWSQQLGNAGGNYVNFRFGATEAAILNAIASGDRFLIALARRLLPVAASLAVSEPIVEIGCSVQLRWTTAEALRVEIDPGLGPVPPQGSLRVSPRKATTYTLTATGEPGSTPATARVTVTVMERAARSLLPPNATELERAMEAATRQPLDVPIRKLWSAEDCPVALLPYLAWALGVEDWDSEWPEAVKRAAVADAFRIHREKGTLAGLKRVLMNAGAEYEYTERPQGKPMTALLQIFNSNAVFLPDIAAAISRVKRASLHLDIELGSAAAGQVPIAGGLGAATLVEFSDWTGY